MPNEMQIKFPLYYQFNWRNHFGHAHILDNLQSKVRGHLWMRQYTPNQTMYWLFVKIKTKNSHSPSINACIPFFFLFDFLFFNYKIPNTLKGKSLFDPKLPASRVYNRYIFTKDFYFWKVNFVAIPTSACNLPETLPSIEHMSQGSRAYWRKNS